MSDEKTHGVEVAINAGGSYVSVKSEDGDLQAVTDVAHKLWQDVREQKPTGHGPAIGYTAEIGREPHLDTDKRYGGEIRPVRAADDQPGA